MLDIVIKKIQIKSARYNYKISRMADVNKTDHNQCWQGCGQLELSCTAGGNINGIFTLEHSLTTSEKVKCILNMTQPFHSIPGYLPWRNEGICLHKDLHMSS